MGGIQTVTLSLATGLAEWGKTHPGESVEVIFVTQTPANGMDESQLPFCVVRRPSVRELIRYVRSADVLHLAGPALLPLLFARFLRTPTVVEHHGYQSVCPNGLLLYAPDQTICPGHFMAARYQKCLKCNAKDLGWAGTFRHLVTTFPRRWLCERVTRNIAVSQHVAMRIALPRTSTIYHGIQDACEVRPDSSPHSADRLRIGYVGRLVGEKGLPLLLDAAKQLAQKGVSFHLTLVGDGTQREELENTTRGLGLQDRVTFTGELQASELEEVLREIQVIVMPSRCEETAGLAAMEQMMRGGVVVAADIGGLSEVVGDAGLKFFTADSAALAACLLQIHENPSLINSLGSAARSRARQFFNLDSMIQRHIRVYEEAIAIERDRSANSHNGRAA